jgi:hypothetical protein
MLFTIEGVRKYLESLKDQQEKTTLLMWTVEDVEIAMGDIGAGPDALSEAEKVGILERLDEEHEGVFGGRLLAAEIRRVLDAKAVHGKAEQGVDELENQGDADDEPGDR